MEQEHKQHQRWTSLYLTDGQEIMVDERAYPMLMEWEWEYDESVGQAVRTDGSGVRLYDEQVRLIAHAEVENYPFLERPALRALFGGLAEFGELIRIVQQQREPVLYMLGFSLPGATAFLAGALGRVLAEYYRWMAAPTRLVARHDPTQLTPGWFEEVQDKPSYGTLGEWMAKEVTGAWRADKDAPTGLSPEAKYIDVMKIVSGEWRLAVRAVNGTKTASRHVEKLLKEEDMPVWRTVQHAIEVIETYRV